MTQSHFIDAHPTFTEFYRVFFWCLLTKMIQSHFIDVHLTITGFYRVFFFTEFDYWVILFGSSPRNGADLLLFFFFRSCGEPARSMRPTRSFRQLISLIDPAGSKRKPEARLFQIRTETYRVFTEFLPSFYRVFSPFFCLFVCFFLLPSFVQGRCPAAAALSTRALR